MAMNRRGHTSSLVVLLVLLVSSSPSCIRTPHRFRARPFLLAMKAYEDHVRRSGESVSHPLMKEMLAGFAAAEVDKLFETKGLDFLDREKAKRHAIQQAHRLADEQYGQGDA